MTAVLDDCALVLVWIGAQWVPIAALADQGHVDAFIAELQSETPTKTINCKISYDPEEE